MTEGVAAKLVPARLDMPPQVSLAFPYGEGGPSKTVDEVRRNANKVDFSIEMEKFEQLRYVELTLNFDETPIK